MRTCKLSRAISATRELSTIPIRTTVTKLADVRVAEIAMSDSGDG